MSVLSERRTPTPGSVSATPSIASRHPAPHTRRLARIPAGLVPSALGLALVVVGAATANPALLLVGLGSGVTALLGRRLPLDLAVPASALALLMSAVVAGSIGAAADVDLLAAPSALLAGYLAFSCSVLVHAVVRPVAAPSCPHPWWAWLSLVPAGLALATGVLQSLSVGVAKSWAFWGTDLIRHMTTIKNLQETGTLDYASSGYPRGLHMLAALANVPAPPSGRIDLMGYDLRLTAALTWVALALMIWTGSVLAVRVARRLGVHDAVGAAAATLVGAGALLINSFVLSFVYMGAAPSLLAAAVLMGIPLAIVAASMRRHRLAYSMVVCATATVALAHLWQALVLAPVLACVVLVAPDLRRLGGELRRPEARRPLLMAALVTGLEAVLSVPPMFGVQQAAGLSYAAVPGQLIGGPWRLLVPGLLAVAVVVLVRRQEMWARACAATAVGLLGATALLLRATSDPLDVTQYYPLKSLWFLTLFCAPLLAVAAGTAAGHSLRWLWRQLGRTGRYAFVLRSTAVAALLGPGLALWLGFLVGVDASAASTWHRAVPTPAGTHRSTTELSAVRFDIAARYGASDGSTVVVPWAVGEASFDPFGRFVTSLLLTFQTGQPEMPTGRVTVCDAITTIAGGEPALVISQQPVREVQRAMTGAGCPGRARVEHVPVTGYRG